MQLLLENQSATAILLIQHGAVLEGEDSNGYTALHHAASQAHEDMVILLLQEGAETNAMTKTGLTALHIVSWTAEAPVMTKGGQPKEKKKKPRDREAKRCNTI